MAYGAGAPPDVVAGVEAEMASLALGWCGLQLQSGHTERGVAGIQALVEYHLFAPAGERAQRARSSSPLAGRLHLRGTRQRCSAPTNPRDDTRQAGGVAVPECLGLHGPKAKSWGS